LRESLAWPSATTCTPAKHSSGLIKPLVSMFDWIVSFVMSVPFRRTASNSLKGLLFCCLEGMLPRKPPLVFPQMDD
jgi:hypothetical protein